MKNIAIIMGGYSSEVEISLKSGAVAYQHLSRKIYHPYRVHILKDKWVVLDDADNEYPINKHDFSTKISDEKITFDCVFNAIHGHPGEDGTILAYFELLGIPHTSAPFYQMALTFDKYDTLSLIKSFGIKAAPSICVFKGDKINEGEIISKIGLPCFIKPSRAGSSFGISKASKKEQIIPAIEKAFTEDNKILIEGFLDGTEISVGVIEYQKKLKVLPITEIVSENDFFDYEAKYEGKSQEITPARISKAQEEKAIATAKKVYKILNMSGFSRSEYIFIDDEPHFLEMNTVPGLASGSLLPQQVAEAGISLEDLFGNAVEQAISL